MSEVPAGQAVNEGAIATVDSEAVGETIRRALLNRREFLMGSAIALGAVGAAACSNLGGGGPVPTTSTTSTTVPIFQNSTISTEHRNTLRALWDAVVPGNWNGNVEDGGASGADQANVEAWLEYVATNISSIGFIDWLTAEFLGLWGADLDAWALLTTLGQQEYWQMPLGNTIIAPSTRQGKIILMQNLLVPGVETIFDLQYLGAIMLAKLAFYCDFWAEQNAPSVRIGRAYCGAHLPPGTTPQPNKGSFGGTFGTNNPNMITVGSGLVGAP